MQNNIQHTCQFWRAVKHAWAFYGRQAELRHLRRQRKKVKLFRQRSAKRTMCKVRPVWLAYLPRPSEVRMFQRRTATGHIRTWGP